MMAAAPNNNQIVKNGVGMPFQEQPIQQQVNV